jgi:hypothetical protein
VIAAVAWPPRIGLGTTIKCPRCTTRQRPERYNQVPATHSKRRCGKRPRRLDQVPATHNERRRGQKPGRLGQLPATHNERRRGQRPKPMPGIAHVPHYHSALHAPCLVRASFANKQNSTAEGLFFFGAAQIIFSLTNKQTEGRAPVWGSEFTTKAAAL